jgi:hypothetical protein
MHGASDKVSHCSVYGGWTGASPCRKLKKTLRLLGKREVVSALVLVTEPYSLLRRATCSNAREGEDGIRRDGLFFAKTSRSFAGIWYFHGMYRACAEHGS